MKRNPTVPLLLTVISIGLALFAFFTGQAAATKTNFTAAESNIDGSFTYQGQLTNNGSPVAGACDLRFSLWDAVRNGSQLGNYQIQTNVALDNGRFTVTLNNANQFSADAFVGSARWLNVEVRCPSGSGSYTTLTPRQAITGTPVAQTLRPGAVISGAVLGNNGDEAMLKLESDNIGLRVESDGTAVFVDSALRGLYVKNALLKGIEIDTAVDGVYVGSVGNPGAVQAPYTHGNGFVVEGAEESGVYVGNANVGMYVNSAALSGLTVSASTGFGLFVHSSGGDGLNVTTTGGDGIEIGNAVYNGLNVGSAGNHGLRVNSANLDGVNIHSAGSPSTYGIPYASGNGIVIGGAARDGVYVGHADRIGVSVNEADNIGVWANTTVSNGEWGFYTHDKISGSNVTLNTLTLIAQVADPAGLSTGDLVAAVGMADPLTFTNTRIPLVQAANETTANGIIGVVEGRMVLTTVPMTKGADANQPTAFHSTEGAAQAGDYVALTVFGIAQVRVDSQASIQPGQRLTAAALPGVVRPLRTETLNEMLVTEGAPIIGIALAAPQADSDTIPVFVTLR
ncbi:MAG: hypothetical protein GY943_17810 [Chloroflexi bacterium]|nr:hypothetical protein [Chloroflexota bacterium]